MKAIILPTALVCGTCNSNLHSRRHNSRPTALVVRCLSQNCTERGVTFLLEMDVRELTPPDPPGHAVPPT